MGASSLLFHVGTVGLQDLTPDAFTHLQVSIFLLRLERYPSVVGQVGSLNECKVLVLEVNIWFQDSTTISKAVHGGFDG